MSAGGPASPSLPPVIPGAVPASGKAQAAPPACACTRLHGLDNLRAAALVLGVALHGGLSYLPGGASWIVMDGARSSVLALPMYVIHMFRMLTFFLLAGFFARLIRERRGLLGLGADRLRRIGLPFAIFLLPMLLAISLLAARAAAVARALGLATAQEPEPPLSAASFPLAHLWFLYVLLLFYGAALVLAAWSPDALARMVDRALPRLLAPPGVLLAAAPLAACLLADPAWRCWWGIPTPDRGLLPNLPALAGYGLAFALGWALRRSPHLLEVLRRRWPAHLVPALLATAACLLIAGPVPPSPDAALAPAPRLAYGCLYAAAAWLWSLGLMGLALRFAERPHPAWRYLADASYFIYIVHMPVVMALQIAFARLSWPWQAEFPLLLALAFAPMLLAYHVGVRGTWLGLLLGGKRSVRAPPDPISD